MTLNTSDEITVRRERILFWVQLGKRVGYGTLLISIIMFGVALATKFATWAVVLSISGLVANCVILPLPIVMGYAVRAAVRENRQTQA